MLPTDSPDGALVYADWLLAQGNVQGELITLQLARQVPGRTPAAQRALRLREEELLVRHAAELTGALPADAELCWRGGFVRELSLKLEPGGAPLAELLARPVFALLERLVVELQREAPADPLLAAAARLGRLRALHLTTGDEQALDLSAFGRLHRLEVFTQGTVNLGPMPDLELLGLTAGGVEGLTPRLQPKLRRAVTDRAGHFEAFRGLELYLSEDDGTDLEELEPSRVVVTLVEDGEYPPGQVAMRTLAQNEERAFLLFEPAPSELKRALERLRQLPLEGVITATQRTFVLGGRELTAVELRSSEPQPSLLRLLANDLAATAPRGVLEAAVSGSTSSALFRGHERAGSSVTTWVIGRRELRRAVDRLFSFDPGLNALEDIFLALDGAPPQSLRGPLPKEAPQLPCCTPLEADLSVYEEEEEEEYDEEDDDEGGYLELVESDAVAEVDAALLGEEEPEEDPDDDPDEPHRDAVDADIEELLTQSPVDLDDEPEEGMEQPLELPRGDEPVQPAMCESCRRAEAVETCHGCATGVCDACLTVVWPPSCAECRSSQPAA